MATGVFNPRDNASATGTRPAHVNLGAGVRRWFTDAAGGTRVYAQDINQIIAQFRAAMDAWGVGDVEGDDTVLTELLAACFAAHGRPNLLPNPSFEHWPNGTGPLSGSGLGPANWIMNNVGTSVSAISRQFGMLNGRYCLEWDFTVAGGVSDAVRLEAFPIIPAVANLSDKRITLTGTIKGEAGIAQLEAQAVQIFGAGGSAFVETLFPPISVTTSPARFEVAVDLPSVIDQDMTSDGGDGTGFIFLRRSTSPLGKIWLEDVKLEVGNRSTIFVPQSDEEERRDFGIPTSKNYVHNPSFLLWQAGQTSVVPSTSNPHIADRWRCRRAVAGATVSRQAGFAGATYCCRLQRDAGNSAVDGIAIGQQLESAAAARFAGKWVILSYDVRGGANMSATGLRVNSSFACGTGIDEAFSPAAVSPSFVTGNTSFDARLQAGSHKSAAPTSGSRRMYSAPWLVPANATEFGWSIGFVPTGTAGAADYIEVTNVKIELCGPHGRATAFEPELPEETLRACQRFYRKSFNVNASPAQNAGAGTGEWRFPATRAAAAQNRLGSVRFGAAMRTAPTITLFNPVAANAQARNLTGGADCSATAAQNVSEQGFEIVATGDGAAAIGDDLGVHWTADARL